MKADADEWLSVYPPGTDPADPIRKQGIDLAGILDNYNNGLIGPGSCDDNEVTSAPTGVSRSLSSETPMPTYTSTSTQTETFTPTVTATPTETPTPTDTSTETPTETITPTQNEGPMPTDTSTATQTETST